MTQTDAGFDLEPVFNELHKRFIRTQQFDVTKLRPHWTPALAYARIREAERIKAQSGRQQLTDDELLFQCLAKITEQPQEIGSATHMHRWLHSQNYAVSIDRVKRAWQRANLQTAGK